MPPPPLLYSSICSTPPPVLGPQTKAKGVSKYNNLIQLTFVISRFVIISSNLELLLYAIAIFNFK